MDGDRKTIIYIVLLVAAVYLMPKIKGNTSNVEQKVSTAASHFGDKLSITKKTL